MLLLVSAVASSLQHRVLQSPDTCVSCVEKSGCTWCEGDSFFGNPSVCMCSGGGFFGGCSDVSFGASPRESKLDCMFNTSRGGGVLAGIIIGCVIFMCCVAFCIRRP